MTPAAIDRQNELEMAAVSNVLPHLDFGFLKMCRWITVGEQLPSIKANRPKGRDAKPRTYSPFPGEDHGGRAAEARRPYSDACKPASARRQAFLVWAARQTAIKGAPPRRLEQPGYRSVTVSSS